MSSDIPLYASVAGELAKNLWGRTDFEKYDFGWAEARNWIVDYRGGLFTRPALEFLDVIEWADGENVKFVPFQFSPDTANTYVIVFTDDKVRFVQDGAYVLEADVTVDSLANSTGDDVEFTATGHGFSDGDWVKLSGFSTNTSLNTRTGEVTNSTATTFELTNPITGEIIEISSVSTETGTVNRIYTVTSPYGQEELGELRATQVADYVRLTHPDYPAKNLIRSGATSWSIADEDIGITTGTVTGLAEDSTSATNGRYFVYQVTAVDENDQEGLPDIVIVTNVDDILGGNGDYVTVSWTAVSGAVKYRVYRGTMITDADAIMPDDPVGFIGETAGVEFTDAGITADSSRRPPLDYNPFANGRIRYAVVNTPGTGAIYDQTITWPAGGTGAYGYVVAKGTTGDPIQNIKVLSGGQDYTGTTISVATASGEDIDAVLSPASGNNPHCCAIFQQRCVYGATDNEPLRLFGSYVGFFANFSYTELGADDESYEFDLDSEAVAPIRHLIPVRGGLLAFTQIGVWLLYGINNEPMSGNNAQADLQTAVGASLIRPVYIDSFVAYAAEKGQEIRMLAYDDYDKLYGGRNISLLSNHLFSADNQITSMSFAETPFKILYATQENGRCIALTVDNENNVFGATPLWTKGYFRELTAVDEDRTSRVYCAVERKIGSNRAMFLERFVRRETFEILEESNCLDSSLELGRTYPSGRLAPDAFTGSVTFTSDGTPFASGDVGKVIRCGDGKATITSFTSSSEVDATWDRDLTDHYPEDEDTPMEFESGDWTMDSTTSSVSGAWHLAGETVSLLRDGTVETGVTVGADGSVALGAASSRVALGIPFTCVAKTLPPTVNDLPIEGRRKAINEVGLRIYRTIGLKVGTEYDTLREIADRGQRLWSSADLLRDVMVREFTLGQWQRDAQVYFVQDTPRPAALLNILRDTELGDDKD